MRNHFVVSLIVAVAMALSSAPVANAKPDPCVALLVRALSQAQGKNLANALTKGQAASNTLSNSKLIRKIQSKCATLPAAIGYTGCPDIAGCAANTTATFDGYKACVDCLMTALTARIAQKTAPAGCGDAQKDTFEECESNADCTNSARPVCQSPGASNQCTCVPAVCGNGVVEPGETCDPQAGVTGCAGTCLDDCTCAVCGDGTKQSNEECDPQAEPTGCCPGASCSNSCVCATGSCSGQGFTKIDFTIGTGASSCAGTCTGAGASPPDGFPCQGDATCAPGTCTLPNATPTGELKDVNGATIGSLFSGCLYFGGADGATPPAQIPNGSTLTAGLQCGCSGQVVVGDAGTGRDDCTLGPLSTKHCQNGAAGTDTQGLCATDADCGGMPRSCLADAQCFFGPPLPISNGQTSTCLMNVINADVTGEGDVSTGAFSMTVPLSTRIFLTGDEVEPCPVCRDNGSGPVCSTGPRSGQACTPVGAKLTTHDCPPDPSLYLGPLPVTLAEMGTGSSALPASPAANRIQCPARFCSAGDVDKIATACTCDDPASTLRLCEAVTSCGTSGVCRAQEPGIFGVATAAQVTESGVSPGPLTDLQGHAAVLSTTFCIPLAGGDGIVDAAAGLPGPGAVAIPGTLQLKP